MSTYKELVYIVSDLAKTISDDTIINESHIVYLLNKYRTYLLRQKFDKLPSTKVPRSMYQTICVDLEKKAFTSQCRDECLLNNKEDIYLVSKNEIPDIFYPSIIKVKGDNIFKTEISMIDPSRMDYVGYNKWLKNTIYGTIYYDNHLYLKSSNTSLYNKNTEENLILSKVHLTAVFDDPIKAMEMSNCEGDTCSICDFMDEKFPFEDALESQLIALVLKEIVGAAYRPNDNTNNANDDLSNLAAFVRQHMKKDNISLRE